MSNSVGMATLSEVIVGSVRNSTVAGNVNINVTTGNIMANAVGVGYGLVMVGSVSNTATGCGCVSVVTGDVMNIPSFNLLGTDQIRIGNIGY